MKQRNASFLPAPVRRTLVTGTAGLLLTLALAMVFAQLAPPVTADEAMPDETMTAGVIVQLNEHASIIRTIEFTEPISGFRALQLSGLDFEFQQFDFGSVVCSIEGVGCPADNCFCDSANYWGYNYWDGADWAGYPVGVSGSVISQTGHIEGFHWGDGTAVMTPATQTLNAGRALLALRAIQADDGGFGSQSGSAEALIAFGANGLAGHAIQPAGGQASLLGYVMLNGPGYTNPPVETAAIAPAAVGKLASGAAGSDTCWASGTATPASVFDPSIGAYSVHPGINAWGILGALAYDGSAPAGAVDLLRTSIQADGGWEWMEGFGTDTNSTALAVQAMIGAGMEISATEVISGLIFLRNAQNDDGGFTYTPGSSSGSDANSTAYVIQALYAAGEDPADPTWTRGDGATPLGYLQSLQLADGSVEWQAGTGSNSLATQQAVPALLGQSFPFGRGIEACDTVWLPYLQRPN